jgi:hypothetical protein
MSARPGKVLVDGVASVGGESVFVLKLIRSREPEPEHRIELARFDPAATWLDQLEAVGGRGRAPFGEPLARSAGRVITAPEGAPTI